jgi:RNA polymerase sigma-70 factor (ECF subfamily)
VADEEEVVAAHGGLVWQTVTRLLGDADEAADCFQDTFLEALRFGDGRRVESWPALLRRIATTRALDRLRRRRAAWRRGAGGQNGQGRCDPARDPAETLCVAEMAARARELIARLPRREAEVFCLYVLSGLDRNEAAHVLGLRVGAVSVFFHKARARMCAWLEADEGRSGSEVQS